MRIETLFKKDIFRPINGVVKADQLDDASVWQELDEFVLTGEMEQHLRRFIDAFVEGIDQPDNPDKNGVWISGFFGSGKSHLLKIISYLFRNLELTHDGQTRKAIDFFETKVKDGMLFADIKRAIEVNSGVILFNIDVKADSSSGRDAILRVFLKVLNEAQDYCPEHPHVAHMERYLESKGKLGDFQAAYQVATGHAWVDERDAYEFNRDEVVATLSGILGLSKESSEKWIDGAESNFSLTVENFAKWTKEYLDSKGPKHRVMFLVDEVGQFIGNDTHRMLNLQTVTEQLGVECRGRAWVVVTSQEDIDKVLGEVRTTKAHDFSKIQGRFPTRLSLSSSNVDEVIAERLLAKNDAVIQDLTSIYEKKGDVLRNQITFTNCGMTFRKYKEADDFVHNYPFTPYQFQLVQKIFDAIRKAGATGLHLSRGERSVLDAFQSAGKSVANEEVGVLVPLYHFYPSIESFLDTAIKRTIDQAKDNPSLEPFDIELLRILFLIRYVEEMKGNVDNLVTLCLHEIDADRLALRRKIEESLLRLEKETLVSRSGDNYFFLTNEERDINREIKAEQLSSGEEAKLLGELIFQERETFNDLRKHRFAANKMDFSFNRLCDGIPVGSKTDGALTLLVVTALNDEYDLYQDSRSVLESNNNGGQVILKLPDDKRLASEIRASIQTDKYLRSRGDSSLPSATRRIHSDLAEENRDRRLRLVTILHDSIISADTFAAGQKITAKATAPVALLDELMGYLVQNTFSKMSYIKKVNENALPEIQAILRANDVQQQSLAIKTDETNPQALDELRSYIELCAKTSRQIVLYELVNDRYGNRPYGWPPMELCLLLARLLVLGEAQLEMDSSLVPLDKAYEPLTTQSKWRKVTIRQRKSSDSATLQKARNLGKDVFSKMGPDGEEQLVGFLRTHLTDWQGHLTGYKTLADTGNYPGKAEIDTSLGTITGLLGCDDPGKFIERFNAQKVDLLDTSEAYHDLDHFYSQQKPVWEKLRKAQERFRLNRMELDRDSDAAAALVRITDILAAQSPYGLIKEAPDLIQKVDSVNTGIIDSARHDALEKLDRHLAAMHAEVEAVKAEAALQTTCLKPLQDLKAQIGRQESVAHINQAVQEAARAFDHAVSQIEDAMAKKAAAEAEQKKKDQSTATPTTTKPPAPVVKKRRLIEPSKIPTKTYLEDQEDIDGFLEELRKQLEAAIENNERVQIR
jgi:hypothetical protein